MNKLKEIGIFFVVFFGVSVMFTWSGVRETPGMDPYAVDALIAACSAVISLFLLKAVRSHRR
jgi:hypothetical protein